MGLSETSLSGVWRRENVSGGLRGGGFDGI